MKLSQFPVNTAPGPLDYVVGVTAAQVDTLYPVNNIGGRTKLTADFSYTVSTTGSDSNPGTASAPFATIQRAMNVIAQNIDTASFVVTVNIGAGTFAGVGLKGTVGGGAIYFKGAGSANTTIINGPNDGVFNFGECIAAWVSINAGYWFTGITLAPRKKGLVPFNNVMNIFAPGFFNMFDERTFTVDGDIVVDCTGMGSLDVVWWIGAAGIQHQANAVSYVGGGATIANVFIIEDGGVHFYGQNGHVSTFGGNLTCSAFCFGDAGGQFQAGAGAFVVSGGTVTGLRFQLLSQSFAFSGVGSGAMGLNFFPGSSAGTATADCTYDGFPVVQMTAAAGVPTTTDLPNNGAYAAFTDGSGNYWMAVNASGTIKKVAMT